MSGCVRMCQEMSGDVRRCQDVSGDVRRCQDVSGCVRMCQDMPGYARRCQEMSGCVRRCQEVSGCVRRCGCGAALAWCLVFTRSRGTLPVAASNRGTAVTMRCQLSPPLSLSPSRTQFKFSLRDGDNTSAPDIISTLYQITQTTDSGVSGPIFQIKMSIVHILEIQTYIQCYKSWEIVRLKECKIETV